MAIYLNKHTVGGVTLLTERPKQDKIVDPTTSQQIIKADEGYELNQVTVMAVDPSDYYKPEETVTVTATESSQTITPEENKVFNEVIVNPISLGEKTITEDGIYLASDDGVNGYKKVTVNAENFKLYHIEATIVGNTQSLAIVDYNGQQNNNYYMGNVSSGNTQQFFIVG